MSPRPFKSSIASGLGFSGLGFSGLAFAGVALLGLSGCKENERSAGSSAAPLQGASGHSPSPRAPLDAGAAVEGFGREPFPTAAAALEAALRWGHPRVVAFGEVHAPKDARVPSATERFRTELLPLLAPRAGTLVVEAWQPSGCNAAVEAKIAKTNQEVVQNQAKQNPNEYLALAQDAKTRGLNPLPLRPTCEESARVADAGAADLSTMLETVTQVAQRTLEGALSRSPAPQLTLFYGGALHNDLRPGPDRAGWSFGPALDRASEGGFVEIDLVVPEFIKDTDVWKSLPWRSAYDEPRDGATVQLLSRTGKSFVLVFARTNVAP